MLDTEQKAYWLGFIAADGAVTIDGHGRHYLRFHLKATDRDHLAKFKEAIAASYIVRSDERTCRFVVCGRRIVQALLTLGMTPKKTRVVGWPSFLANDLLRHFCRGYFDGDGCWHTDKHGSLRFVITGNRDFVVEAQKFLVRQCDLNFTKFQEHSPHCVSLVYGGNFVCRKLFDLIYQGATVWLPRKRELAFAAVGDEKWSIRKTSRGTT